MAERNIVPVVWLNYTDAPKRGYWDQGMVEDIFNNRMFDAGYKFFHLERLDDGLVGAVVIFAARNQTEFIARLNKDLAKLKWVILMLTGDEESAFPIEQIKHKHIKIWVMSPRPQRHEKYSVLGTGYPPHLKSNMPPQAPDKDLDWYFGGQITHERRGAMAIKLNEMLTHSKAKGEFDPSEGFTKGLPPAEYDKKLASAKVAPAPSGPETPDSFRLFEALEVGAIPIADTQAPKGDWPDDYWIYFFKEEPPFPILRHYDHLQGYVEDMAKQYPVKNNQVFAWWQMKKYQMVKKVREQIHKLSGLAPAIPDITILMPTSPAQLHPSTEHIEQNIRDVREQLPDTPIILMIDGVRKEQRGRKKDYEEYQRRLLWLCNFAWDNVLPIRFEKFGHQSTMTREALKLVESPYILFVEHDAPLVPDYPIEWDGLKKTIETGQANAIRLHHESGIHPEHKHLMIGEPELVEGVKMWRTAQWSQRPHLVSTAFYRHVIDTYFSEKSRAFIEHGLYGPIIEAYNREGLMGWNLWKLWVYYPDDTPQGNIQRSYDLNSRGSEPNYASIF